MRLIIFVLSLGASITSIIHGVFMLFGALTTETGLTGLPSIWLASLPVISAFVALVGGLVAFNGSRWGALLLTFATVLCAFAPRDIWLYGGIYFVAALLCLFLRPRREDAADRYSDSDEEEEEEGDYDAYGYDMEERPGRAGPRRFDPTPPQRVRRRTSKACHRCGATVPIESRFCPLCGEPLYAPEPPQELDPEEGIIPSEERDAPVPVPDIPAEGLTEEGAAPEAERPARKVLVRPEYEEAELPRAPINVKPDPAYQEFRRYAGPRKRRRNSAGRRILSLLLLFGVLGGALWFLLNLRKMPEGELPKNDRPVVVAPPVEQKADELAQPSAQQPPVAKAEQALPAFTPNLQPTHGVINGSSVNLREEHTTSSRSLARLNTNARVDILESWTGQSGNLNGTWYHVRTEGREGWIFGRYVRPVGDGLPSGYSNALIQSFGGTRAALTEKLGQPVKTTNTTLEWRGLTATLQGDTVTRLRLTNAQHALQNGLKTGMSQTALLQLMGYPSSLSQRQAQYNEEGKAGVTIQLRDNVIQNITVNRVGS